MTLILNWVTHDWAFQVSDRRLTDAQSGGVVDSDRNKSVLFCHRLAFSYTGLSQIHGEPTDEWLTRILAQSSAESGSQAIDVIKAKATEAFRTIRVRNSSWKRTAFAGIGWAHTSAEEPWKPLCCLISNFDGDRVLQEPLDEFKSWYWFLQPYEAFGFFPVGQHLSPSERSQLRRNIEKCFRRRLGPSSVLRMLVHSLRQVAERNKTVGMDLLAVSFPRNAAGQPMMVSGLNPNYVACMYVPHGENLGRWHAPNVACGGMALSNIGGGAIRNGQSTFRGA